MGDSRIGHHGKRGSPVVFVTRPLDVGKQVSGLALDQGDRDGVLVRKILAKRSDADTGAIATALVVYPSSPRSSRMRAAASTMISTVTAERA